jgi:hypothetical protein
VHDWPIFDSVRPHLLSRLFSYFLIAGSLLRSASPSSRATRTVESRRSGTTGLSRSLSSSSSRERGEREKRRNEVGGKCCSLFFCSALVFCTSLVVDSSPSSASRDCRPKGENRRSEKTLLFLPPFTFSLFLASNRPSTPPVNSSVSLYPLCPSRRLPMASSSFLSPSSPPSSPRCSTHSHSAGGVCGDLSVSEERADLAKHEPRRLLPVSHLRSTTKRDEALVGRPEELRHSRVI